MIKSDIGIKIKYWIKIITILPVLYNGVVALLEKLKDELDGVF